MTKPLTVVVAGLGYFSQFHLKAWQDNPFVDIVGLCDPDLSRREASNLSVPTSASLDDLLHVVQPDIIDIVAPPAAHAQMIQASLAKGRTLICQKPFATSLDSASALVDAAEAADTRLIIHENFRFQPWHRAAHAFLQTGRMGKVYQAHFDLRPGDGRGADAYLARQPAFQTMPRFLIQETGVHFIDLFRWMLGPVDTVYADLRRLNPAIAGEDAGLMVLNHASGAQSVLDGNRLSDHVTTDPRRTMGEMRIEGEGGHLSLDGSGGLQFRPFGRATAEAIPVPDIDPDSFGGGCVANLINHVVDALKNGTPPENLARDYLQVMRILDATYESAKSGRRLTV